MISQIAHIRADSQGGPRFDSAQTEGERRAFENLIVMCPNHHTLIDKVPEQYPVEDLIEMKRQHEAQNRDWTPSPELLAKFSAGVHSR